MTNALDFEDFESVCKKMYPPSFIFSFLQTKKALDKVLIEELIR